MFEDLTPQLHRQSVNAIESRLWDLFQFLSQFSINFRLSLRILDRADDVHGPEADCVKTKGE
jgi:hypothetical protein